MYVGREYIRGGRRIWKVGGGGRVEGCSVLDRGWVVLKAAGPLLCWNQVQGNDKKPSEKKSEDEAAAERDKARWRGGGAERRVKKFVCCPHFLCRFPFRVLFLFLLVPAAAGGTGVRAA